MTSLYTITWQMWLEKVNGVLKQGMILWWVMACPGILLVAIKRFQPIAGRRCGSTLGQSPLTWTHYYTILHTHYDIHLEAWFVPSSSEQERIIITPLSLKEGALLCPLHSLCYDQRCPELKGSFFYWNKEKGEKLFIYLSCKTVAHMGLPGTVSFAEALNF